MKKVFLLNLQISFSEAFFVFFVWFSENQKKIQLIWTFFSLFADCLANFIPFWSLLCFTALSVIQKTHIINGIVRYQVSAVFVLIFFVEKYEKNEFFKNILLQF